MADPDALYTCHQPIIVLVLVQFSVCNLNVVQSPCEVSTEYKKHHNKLLNVCRHILTYECCQDIHTFFASLPTGTCGPRRLLNVNRIICRFAKINNITKVNTPPPIMMIIITPDSCSILYVFQLEFSTIPNYCF